jgi:hypothetical protein
VRTEIVDRNLPLAIAVTPQSFEAAVSRFVKKTRYTMEQFFGRNFLTCRLPDALREADMIAVAKFHFPGMDEDTLGYIASEARLSQNYLQAVEGIAKRAQWKAARANRSVGLKDLRAAVAEVLSREAPAEEALPSVSAHLAEQITKLSNLAPPGEALPSVSASGHPPAGACPHASTVSRLVNSPCRGPARAVKPAAGGVAEGLDFPGRSLRGAGPDKAKAEPVSADS